MAVPGGVLAGLPLLPATFVGFLGNVVTLLPVIFAGDWIRDWYERRRKRRDDEEHDSQLDDHASESRRKQRSRRILQRYGVPGLALLGPFVTGVHAAAALAMASGASRHSILGWFSLSIAVSALFFGLLTDLGLATFAGEPSLPLADE